MYSAVDFIGMVDSICKRRHLYVCGGTFYEVCAFLSGYATASPTCSLSGEKWRAFNSFVCARLRFPEKLAWPYVIKQACHDDDEAVERLRDLLVEFDRRIQSESPEEFVRDEMSHARSQVEGEPEKAWRRFFRAYLAGKRIEIEPLIQPHPEAEILWSGGCPDDVAGLLSQIDESYLISKISGSEDSGEVTLITADFGAIALKRTTTGWKVDATPIIECRKANARDGLGDA
jgi:hypothetical protein